MLGDVFIAAPKLSLWAEAVFGGFLKAVQTDMCQQYFRQRCFCFESSRTKLTCCHLGGATPPFPSPLLPSSVNRGCIIVKFWLIELLDVQFASRELVCKTLPSYLLKFWDSAIEKFRLSHQFIFFLPVLQMKQWINLLKDLQLAPLAQLLLFWLLAV